MMKTACMFPGQGAQFAGMGRALCEGSPIARRLFAEADSLLGYPLSEVMFHGPEERLTETRVTQPAVFLHSYAAYCCRHREPPDMVAGHSLGEFTALAVNGCLTFADALLIVRRRAEAMQKACMRQPSGMLAVMKFDPARIEEVCSGITDATVQPANYNCPQQTVISGTEKGLRRAEEELHAAGARFLVRLKVGGAFHSALMKPAQEELAKAINECDFHTPACPVYQNATGLPSTDPGIIRQNLVRQLTSPVRWTDTIRNMSADGAVRFVEFGPGAVLQGLVRKIVPGAEVGGHS